MLIAPGLVQLELLEADRNELCQRVHRHGTRSEPSKVLREERSEQRQALQSSDPPRDLCLVKERLPGLAMQIQLYHRWHCPYSKRVRDFVDENGLGDQIQYLELGEVAGAEEKLAELTGRSQVPCLVVDGEPILESADVVRWLEANLLETRARL